MPKKKATNKRSSLSLPTKTVPIESLKLDPENKRKHGPESIKAIRSSLRACGGQVVPLIVQKSRNRVIAGNGTLVAMREEGYTKCSIVVRDVDDEQARIMAILLNRTQEYSEWEDDAADDLDELIASLDDESAAWIFEELSKELTDPDESTSTKTKTDGDGDQEPKPKTNKASAKKQTPDDATYVVIAECKDESEQKKVYDLLTEKKVKCRVSTLY